MPGEVCDDELDEARVLLSLGKRSAGEAGAPAPGEEPEKSSTSPGERARRMRWAALLRRVFEIDALRCPRWGSNLRLIAAIEDPFVARRILECLDLLARAPPLAGAPIDAERESREDEELFDQSRAYDDGW